MFWPLVSGIFGPELENWENWYLDLGLIWNIGEGIWTFPSMLIKIQNKLSNILESVTSRNMLESVFWILLWQYELLNSFWTWICFIYHSCHVNILMSYRPWTSCCLLSCVNSPFRYYNFRVCKDRSKEARVELRVAKLAGYFVRDCALSKEAPCFCIF